MLLHNSRGEDEVVRPREVQGTPREGGWETGRDHVLIPENGCKRSRLAVTGNPATYLLGRQLVVLPKGGCPGSVATQSICANADLLGQATRGQVW